MSNGQPTNSTIERWMDEIKHGRIGLPRFQRKFVWKDDTISKLILAIIRKKPVGTLLLFKYDGKYKLFKPHSVVGADDCFDENHCDKVILDGQQRLTAIWCVLNNKPLGEEVIKKEFFMEINKKNEQNFIVSIKCKKTNENNRELDEKKYFCDENLVPARFLSKELRYEIKPWFEKMCSDSAELEILYRKIDQCNVDFNARDISYHIIPEDENSKDMDPKEVIDTFITINTSSIKMTQFEIAIALIEGENIKGSSWERFRDNIEKIKIEKERLERFFPSKLRTNKLGELILKVACLLTKKRSDRDNGEIITLVPKKSNYTDSDVVMTVVDKWYKIIDSIDHTLKFLERESIYDEKRLPSEVPLRVLPALYANIPMNVDSDNEGQINELIRSYLWRSFVTERYDRSAESRLHQDYVMLRTMIENIIKNGHSDEGIDYILNSNKYPIPEIAIISNMEDALKSPKSSDKLSKALLILSLKKGAWDLASGDEIDFSNIKNREYHHLFPQKMLKNEGRKNNEIDHPLNFVLIQANSNRKIAAKKPEDYLSQRVVGNIKEKDIRKRVETHLIPYDELNVKTGRNGNYEKFIKKRAEMMVMALKDLCEGKKLS